MSNDRQRGWSPINKELKMRKGTMVKTVGVTAALALTLAACSGGSDTPATSDATSGTTSGDTIYIAMISKGFQHQFWQTVKLGAEQRAEELGVTITFEGPAQESEVAQQLDMLRAAIEKKPDAIAYAAPDPEACVPLYEEAKAAGIPIVEFDAGCASDYASSIARTDGIGAGALAADHMAELIGGAGEVAIVSHSQVNPTGVERRDGFVNQMAAEYPDIKIVDIQYGDGDHLKSADIAKAMIAANPNLKGIYGTNEGSAIGVVNAVNELKLEPGDLTVVGFDSGQAQIDAINNGLMAGAITQDPIGIGALAVQSAYDIIMGKTVEPVVDTGYYWYDATNLEDPQIAALLYK